MADPLAAAAAPPAQARPTAVPSALPHAPPPAPPMPQSGPTGHDAPPPAIPAVSPDAAARSRMHECGHQWSTLKKAGNVGTMTWKDFSATCLIVSK